MFHKRINVDIRIGRPPKILITGGTGSLGTALLQRIENEDWDVDVTILARNETKMNQTVSRFPFVRPMIGDIRDLSWLHTVVPGHEFIIHTAAIKIVPVAESNPREAFLTNVMGSLNVAQAAVEAGVSRVLGISTDKASGGSTYYGATKRLMEGILKQANDWGNTEFVMCRYGNVCGSSNSVVPFFRKQIEKNIPFTITDFQMTRFWLSMKQAVDLVFFTLEHAQKGTIVVPKAPAMKVADVARFLDPDREQVEIGIRAGERLHETLVMSEESMHTLSTDKHFIIYPPETFSGERNLPFQYEYKSDNPDHWLTLTEFGDLLEDS